MDIGSISEKAPPPNGWAQAHSLDNIHLIIFSSSEQYEGVQHVQFARDILNLFQKTYSENSKNTLNALKLAIESSKEKGIGISAFVLTDKIVFTALSEESTLTLTRNNQEIILISTQKESKSGSGRVNPGDKFTLSHSSGATITASATPNPPAMPETLPITSAPNPQNDPASAIAWLHTSSNLISKASKIPFSITRRRMRPKGNITTLEDKRNSKAPLIGSMLLGILIISIFFGLKQKRKQEQINQYLPILSQAQHELEEAKALSSLNTARARELVLSAKTKADNLDENELNDPQISALKEEITMSLGPIAGIYEINPEIFLDLNILRQGFLADKISISDDKIKVLDSTNQRLAAIDIITKNTQVIAGKEDLFNAFNLATYTDKNFVVSQDGIREIGEEVVLQVKPDNWNPNDSLLFAFAGNLYILDKASSEIWRYPGIPSGFAEPTRWLAPGITPSLNKVVSWSIDGSLWLLEEGGKLSKYTQGAPEAFNIKGVDTPLANPSQIFTSDEAQNLYILDPQNNRILALGKSGDYKAEYIADNLKDAHSIVVSETAKKAVFNIGSNLYSIELKHLGE